MTRNVENVGKMPLIIDRSCWVKVDPICSLIEVITSPRNGLRP
jgi:hypothetical protein